MKKYAFGIDVGGTTVKMGFFETEGNLLSKWEITTRKEDGGSHILDDIVDSINEHLSMRHLTLEDIEGIGICVPGPVDKHGIVNKCVNLGWGVIPLREQLENRLGVKVRVGNDANIAALGEFWKGGGQGHMDLIMLTLGTGVGGAVIVDGKVVTGVGGSAAELGHVKVNYEETETCGCGGRGCLEHYTSATGIARMARKMEDEYNGTSYLDGTEMTAKDVFDGMAQGDLLCKDIAERVCKILGRAIANFAAVTNPSVFVIGGGVSKAGTVLTDMIEKYYHEYAFHACNDAKVVLATLGNDAGMYGCVRMLLEDC